MSARAGIAKVRAAAPGVDERCPPEESLLDLAAGLIDGEPFEALLAHLDLCAACRRMVAELAASPRGESLALADEALGARPESIGRFWVLEELGRGGMGVVYAAFDPTLDRKVALKQVRPDPALPAPAARAQLLAEAQALARLSHPNVVTLFEASTHAGQFYLVMELMRGPSLRELCLRRPGTAEVLARFREAGMGLQAAHDAGLVHRDFKPDNALLGDDGRACVTDFGLAQDRLRVRPARRTDRPGHDDRESLGNGARAAAAPSGTPGYIAPELWLGHAPDARSDQFSFCVSLWEALFGARPFDAERGQALLEQVRRGPIAPPRPELSLRDAVPLRVRRALIRGLAPSPQERHPSLRALLAELGEVSPAHAHAASRPLLAALAAGLLAAGAASHALWLESRKPLPGAAQPIFAADAPLAPDESVELLACSSQPGDSSLARRTSTLAEATNAADVPHSADAPPLALAALEPRPTRSSRRRPSRAAPASPAAATPATFAHAQLAQERERDAGPAPLPNGASSGGGGSTGASAVAPDTDAALGARTLR